MSGGGYVIVLVLVLRDIVGLVFIIAAAAKLADVEGFGRTLIAILERFPGSGPVASLLARSVPALEGMAGLATVSGIAPTVMLVVDGGLVAAFLMLIAYAKVSQLAVECRCFGSLTNSSFGRTAVMRLVLLGGVILILLWTPAARVPTSPSVAGALAAAYGMIALVAAQASRTLSVLPTRRGGPS